MSQIIKAFTGIFFLLLLVLLGNGIVSAQLGSAAAREYKDAVVEEIENSNFSPLVMNACINQAQADGYELRIAVYQEGEKTIELSEQKVTDPAAFTRVQMAEVTLSYDYKIGFLNYSSRQRVRGYAI